MSVSLSVVEHVTKDSQMITFSVVQQYLLIPHRDK